MYGGKYSDKPVHTLYFDKPPDGDHGLFTVLRQLFRVMLKEIGYCDDLGVLIITHDLAYLIGKAGREQDKRVKPVVVAAEAVEQLFVKAVILMELAKLIYARTAIF